MTSASKGHRRQVSTFLLPICTTIAPKVRRRLILSSIVIQQQDAKSARALPQTYSSSILRVAISSSASATTSAPLGLSIVLVEFHPQPVFRTSTPLVPLVLAHLLLARLSQPVFRLSAPPWPLALAHSPLTQHFSASDHVFSCPWVLSALAYNRRVQAVFC